jgi:hypothetical protein
MPCSASQVVPGAHRVVGPGTHRGSGPREVHTTSAVTSDQWSTSSPSPSALCSHPHRCATNPGTAAPSPALWEPGTTRHHHRCCASSSPPSAQPSSWCTDDDQTRGSHTTILEVAPGLATTPIEARFVNTAINSTTLCATSPYVALELCGTIVNRLPLAYKRRGRPPGRGGGGELHTRTFPPSPRYWHFASIKPQGPGGFSSSPTLLVAPSASTMVHCNTTPWAHPCWTYGPWPEPG